MNKIYDIYCESQNKTGKPRCGDSCSYRIIKEGNPGEEIVILAISDGISTCKDDNLASKTTCKTVIDEFLNSTGGIKDRMIKSIQNTNKTVRDISTNPGEYTATLLLVAWKAGDNRIYYFSIGDSRIFKYTIDGIKLLTRDDSESVLLKIAGEPVVKNGVPIFRQGLTRYIGQLTDIDKEIFETDFHEGESIVLATDGIHNNGNLPKYFVDLVNKYDLEDELKSFVKDCVDTNNDDATILFLRRNDYSEETEITMETAIKNPEDYEKLGLYGHIITKYSYDIMENIIINNIPDKKDILINILEYINKYQLKIPRDSLLNLFNKYLTLENPDMTVYNLFHNLISKSF